MRRMTLLSGLVWVGVAACSGATSPSECDLAVQQIRNGKTIAEADQLKCREALSRYYEELCTRHGTKQNFEFPEPDRTLFYVTAIKTAIVDPVGNGGWPFRSSIRLHVFDELNRMMGATNDPFLAFCALFPALDRQNTAGAVKCFEVLKTQDVFLAKLSVNWSVQWSRDPEWLISHYMTAGQPDRAVEVADWAAETGFLRGQEAKGHLLERLAEYARAEDCYKDIEKRHHYVGALAAFYRRCGAQKDATGTPYGQRYEELTKRCFPHGLQKVALADFSSSPTEGVAFSQENDATRRYGFGPGTVVSAVEGYRIANLEQYYFVREMEGSSSQMNLIVWDGLQYKEVLVKVLNRRFGVDLENYHAEVARPVMPTDSGNVFQPLAGLGLVNLATATYVKVQGLWNPPIEEPLPYGYESSGNAWMISETRDAQGQPVKGTFVVNGGQVLEIRWTAPRSRRAVEADPLAPPPAVVTDLAGSWRKARLDQDVKTALRFVKSVERDSASAYLLKAWQGKLCLLAFALEQQGATSNAQQLVSEVLRHAEPRQQVIRDALNAAADAQYENLYRRFQATHDWAAYRDGIKELLARYPSDWSKAPAMKLLLDGVEKRLTQPSPVPSATNVLTGAELKLAGDMLGLRAIRVRPDRYSPSSVLWLVPASWKGRAATDTELQARGRGVQGIPFLLALAADGALTEADRAAVGGGDTMPVPVMPFTPETDRRQAAREAFAALNRPATRGEIAMRWLADMVPDSFTGGPYNQKKGPELIKAFQAFHDQHGQDGDEELAALCLPGRYGSLNEPAAEFLLKQAATKRVPALERILLAGKAEGGGHDIELEPGVPQAKVNLLVQYAALRGGEARPTVQAFAAQLRNAADAFKKPKNYSFPDAEHEAAFVEQNRMSLRKTAEDLEAVTYERSVEERVGKVAGGKGTAFDRLTLQAQLAALPGPEAMGLLLKRAAASEQPQARITLAGLLRSVAAKGAMTGGKPTEHADLWQALIADDRAVGSDGTLVSDQFLALNEQLFAGGDGAGKEGLAGGFDRVSREQRPASQLIADFGRQGREWLRGRVKERLAGKPEDKLPRYPADLPFDAKDAERVKRKLEDATGGRQVIEAVGGLSLYERAMLPELLRREPGLQARLTPLANTITKVTAEGGDPATQAKWLAWQGKAFDRALVAELQTYCTMQAKEGRPATCRLTRGRDFAGCEVTIQQGKSSTEGEKPEQGGAAQTRTVAGLTGLVCGRDLYQAVAWRTAEEPEAPAWGNVETSAPDDLRAFQRAIDDVCGVKLAACDEAFVAFGTKGDRK